MSKDKDNVIPLFKDKVPVSKAKKESTIKSKGNHNVIVQDSQDIQININKTERKISKFTPTNEHISSEQAKKIQDIILNLVEKETASGNVSRQTIFIKYYSMLKKQYKVPTYLAIPAHLGESAIKYLQRQSAIKRTKIRRTDNASWRKELYAGIYAKSNNLGFSKGELYNFISKKLGKQIFSLTKLGERDLKKIYTIIMGLKVE